jgi:structural maintenance of chromosome 4
MKPKAQNPNDTGLLEYLEEIIGSNKYVEDIEKAYQELEQLNEQKQQKSARVKLAEKEMSSLKV